MDDYDRGNTEPDDDDSDITTLLRLAEEAVIDTLGRPYPRPSVARLDELAAREDGAASIYAIFMTWIDAWLNLVGKGRGDLGPDDIWHFANEHILVPDLGGNSDAGLAVRRLLLYKIDGDPSTDSDSDDAVSQDGNGDNAVVYFYENIFRPGAEFRAECALILLFMIKAAFVDAQRSGRFTTGTLTSRW